MREIITKNYLKKKEIYRENICLQKKKYREAKKS